LEKTCFNLFGGENYRDIKPIFYVPTVNLPNIDMYLTHKGAFLSI